MPRPRIAFLSSVDAASPGAYSGTPFYMARALREHCGEVVHVGPVSTPQMLAGRIRNKLSSRLLGRPWPFQHSRAVAKAFGRRFSRMIPPGADVIFAPFGAVEVAYLETDLPIIYASDATVALMRGGYYAGFASRSARYDAQADEVERRTLRRAAAAVYPSRWALASARDTYGADPARLHRIPLGANLDRVPPREAVGPAKPVNVCQVTFLGVDWERKGGPVAFQAVSLLRQAGVDARLTVCGTTPPPEYRADWLTVVPRLDKSVPEQEAALSRLLLESSFLLLPTRAEAFGIVFCEASAHGTPSLAPDTGGVSDAVLDGRNGYVLPNGATADQYAARMLETFGDRERYQALVQSSRAAYEDELNWGAWAHRMRDVIAAVA